MLYLVEPSGRTQWCDIPARTVLEVVRERGADLTRLEWLRADRVAGPNDVRVALRHGVAVPGGIVVDGGLLVEQDRSSDIRAAHRQAAASRASISEQHNAMMERLMPGWIEYGRKIDRGVDESMERSAVEADEDAATYLGGEPDPALVEHWRSIGGRLPSSG